MKRSGPPERRTPLKSGSQLRSNKPLQSKQQLRPRSAKAQKLYREKRVPLVKKVLAERPWCEACKVFAELDGLQFFRVRASVDLHEIKSRGRTGGIHSEEWLDEENILAVCREDHSRITSNPDEAEFLGLSAPSCDGSIETARTIRELRANGQEDQAVEVWRTYPGNTSKPIPK